VRQLEELIKQAELVDELERGRMHGIAPKIAEKICMLFQNGNAHPGARKEKAKHHSGRSAADDATLGAQRSARHNQFHRLKGASPCGKPVGHSIGRGRIGAQESGMSVRPAER
jgi:hypothetical protein